MHYRQLGKTGLRISSVTYGGIVSAGFYDGKSYAHLGQEASDRFVSFAIESGVNYFDVAPSYGNAQQQLGNSLLPYRSNVFLACKTGRRDAKGAREELLSSLKDLHTDHFDVYQLHGVSSMAEAEQALGPGGALETLVWAKKEGLVRNVGFSAHSEEAALHLIANYDFATVLFPFNWLMHSAHGMGDRLMQVAKEKDMGVIAMKAFIERKWESKAEQEASPFPKSWCKPIAVEDEAFGMAAMRYTLSLGADTLVPPGNFESFRFAAEHIDACIETPLSAAETALLEAQKQENLGKEFF